ncbi:tyrosine recombinase XerC [Herbaspirillum sp. RTI4]|uniref:tyrosine recombinase XerC n=1 Tax=Herbaspirillum sp. RTI4 TaxID=3048640 RepID=UPI002AB4B6F4|nr:tyrosine recombinase XerC [Herbaspirillum sp. RTI4]MDY7576930.1 tyrosine recombinase XerC [Herbaspirillum sp. RTI4]MEA9983199.1 tyrosine recombinase XerC [Herbaspirillum sp. RTI4]
MPNLASDAEQIRHYLGYLRDQRQLALHTVNNYARDLAELMALIAADNTPRLAELTQHDIRKCAARLHAKGQNARSIARKLSAWRGFFNWLSEQTKLKSNPVDAVKAPKKSKPLPKALAQDEAIRLVSQASPAKDAASTLQMSNRAMFELLYSSGLRVSELCGLDIHYVKQADHISAGWMDMEGSDVTVTGKGGKMRSVPVGKPALEAIRAWLAIRDTLSRESPASDHFALFLNERGSRISPRVAHLRLKAHALALGVTSNVHPHVLRHSFASHVLQGSGDLRAVQEMLGHASIAATQIYTSLDFQRLAQVYDAAHPRAKKIDTK